MSKVNFTDEDLENGTDLDWSEEKEHWNKYKLSDGTELRIKLILQRVKRLQKWKPDGTPIYIIMSTSVVRSLNISRKLRRKPKTQTFKPV